MTYSEDHAEWGDFYPVYDAPDEATAIHMCSLLRGGGLEARIRSAQIPCFDGAFASAVGYWGQVVVPKREVLVAANLVEAIRRELRCTGER
ncbi:MAG: hypothetical protein KAY24_06735 [Candidatus Eisenbacteria sp.]|nr:hypothetical protein [Candidatus Eisenbacteria bacterium]